ncbi:tyrosine-protein phosphatase [Enterococcus casseliflavus]|uniref:tyrosine-protein phosphatase n=1 Tax=Enterococcus casseliflavus TaxID=37734 RepID=UPI0018ABE4AA|nr:tyrosine-protein phosphatase [Enterococcus casseliflavus]
MTQLIQLERAANVRELGGYQTTNGTTIKRKKLIRSAAINELTASDQAVLANYGVNQVIDFRSIAEANAQPDRPIATAKQLFLPIFKEDETMVSLSPESLKQRLEDGEDAEEQMKKVYRHFVESDYARQQYRQFFDHVIANAEGEGATLFHCTAGKDRTGFGAFLLLHVLAVAPTTIKEDYLATNRYLAPMIKEKFAPMTQHLPQELLTAITVLMSAKESFLDESLAAIDQHFGSVDQYLLQGLGVTKEEQAYLNAQLTE